MNLVSLFSGCGGLDLGFERAGFNIIWANELDKTIHETYRKNFPNTFLDTRDIKNIPSQDIPDCDGIIGGPPCQSWSCGGMKKGFKDKRGLLFLEFIRIITEKQPKFFLAENVKGILSKKKELSEILLMFEKAGYNVMYFLVKVSEYGVAQDRERVFFIGTKNMRFVPELKKSKKIVLRDIIYDIRDTAVPSCGWDTNRNVVLNSHEYLDSNICGYSPHYMSRNRVRSWDEPGFTVVSSARHVTLHPSSPPMVKIKKDLFSFVENSTYRRLSVRECARIQSFPDAFLFFYKKISDGYKMVGNSVPPIISEKIAKNIKKIIPILNRNYSQYVSFIFD